MTEWKTYRLGDICDYVISRTSRIENYISTENMLPNKGGVCTPSNIPNGVAVEYRVGDVLISNIRPYFRKIWQADRNGTCSADVLCIRANDKVDSKYLYYLLSQQLFFDYVMSGAKGCKMPRGDKKQIMQWSISLPSLAEQRRIAGILGAIDDKIENNRRINTNLELQAQALYKQWFVDNRNKDWETLTLDDVAAISAGGDKPQVCSEQKTQECNIPIYSNSIDREGLYGYTNNPRIIENSITISARGTIGYVCLRTEPYVPIVRLISVIPTHDNMSAYFLYLWALTQNISGTGTTQQQLTVPAFRTTQIVVPSQETLLRFNKVVKPIFDCIKQNKVENEILATLRDTLLPKLMNGEIKL
jgi:type I restriction enzyme S subunit